MTDVRKLKRAEEYLRQALLTNLFTSAPLSQLWARAAVVLFSKTSSVADCLLRFILLYSHASDIFRHTPDLRPSNACSPTRVVHKCWKIIMTCDVACRKEGFEPTACAVAQRIRELDADQQELDRSARSMLESEIRAFAEGYAGRQMVSILVLVCFAFTSD